MTIGNLMIIDFILNKRLCSNIPLEAYCPIRCTTVGQSTLGHNKLKSKIKKRRIDIIQVKYLKLILIEFLENCLKLQVIASF